jgi:hypothetical protein
MSEPRASSDGEKGEPFGGPNEPARRAEFVPPLPKECHPRGTLSSERETPDDMEPADDDGGLETQLFDLRRLWGLSVELSVDDREALADATDLLRRRIRPDRLELVIRRPAPTLEGRSLLEMVAAGEFQAVRESVVRMFELKSY